MQVWKWFFLVVPASSFENRRGRPAATASPSTHAAPVAVVADGDVRFDARLQLQRLSIANIHVNDDEDADADVVVDDMVAE